MGLDQSPRTKSSFRVEGREQRQPAQPTCTSSDAPWSRYVMPSIACSMDCVLSIVGSSSGDGVGVDEADVDVDVCVFVVSASSSCKSSQRASTSHKDQLQMRTLV